MSSFSTFWLNYTHISTPAASLHSCGDSQTMPTSAVQLASTQHFITVGGALMLNEGLELEHSTGTQWSQGERTLASHTVLALLLILV